MLQELKSAVAERSERIQVELEPTLEGQRVKIRLESYDANLGWYSCGSLTLPIHQLPLLEQAVADMRASKRCETTESAKIIPFPTQS